MSDDSRDHPFGRRSPGRPSRTNGHDPEGMGTQPVPLDEAREPLDLVAVQADDELISALSAGLAVSTPGVHGYDADDHVAAMLAAWKADVDSEPIPPVDLDAAVDAVLAGTRPASRRRPGTAIRHLVPVASAAALIVVAITGVSIAAHDTRPGDTLFPVSKVLYAEEARSYEALDTVEQSKVRAKEALAHGDKQGAEAAVAQGQAAAESVLAEHGRGEVEQKLHKLEVVVDDSEQGVPTIVKDEDKPARGGGQQGHSGSSSQDPSKDPSSSGTGSSDPGTQDQGRPGDPSDRPGSDEPDPSSSGTTKPEPTTSKPDPRAADTPPDSEKPGSTAASEPGSSTEPPKQPTSADPSTEPAPTHTSAAPPPAGAATTHPAPATTSTDPSVKHPPSTTAPTRTTTPGTGISGASMSATGTATPSGEPTS